MWECLIATNSTTFNIVDLRPLLIARRPHETIIIVHQPVSPETQKATILLSRKFRGPKAKS
ncbi:hypothetical protein RHGRI_015697 [Rhododendron griersonianum]|uniref:Uncharacterized protein n=1 Tax=Rhododendron griersonianum TaxID=479676 RepID=A0AAV6KEI9_9ERIC|nr:hypothetical protein RHGRI_015697 [Rhododendron griersonianum]